VAPRVLGAGGAVSRGTGVAGPGFSAGFGLSAACGDFGLSARRAGSGALGRGAWRERSNIFANGSFAGLAAGRAAALRSAAFSSLVAVPGVVVELDTKLGSGLKSVRFMTVAFVAWFLKGQAPGAPR